MKLCLSLRCGTILSMKLTDMQKQGLHKDKVKTNLCVIDYIINNMNISSECITSVFFRLHDYLE